MKCVLRFPPWILAWLRTSDSSHTKEVYTSTPFKTSRENRLFKTKDPLKRWNILLNKKQSGSSLTKYFLSVPAEQQLLCNSHNVMKTWFSRKCNDFFCVSSVRVISCHIIFEKGLLVNSNGYIVLLDIVVRFCLQKGFPGKSYIWQQYSTPCYFLGRFRIGCPLSFSNSWATTSEPHLISLILIPWIFMCGPRL